MKGSKHVAVHNMARHTKKSSQDLTWINSIQYLKELDKIIDKDDKTGYGDDLKKAVTHRFLNKKGSKSKKTKLADLKFIGKIKEQIMRQTCPDFLGFLGIMDEKNELGLSTLMVSTDELIDGQVELFLEDNFVGADLQEKLKDE